MENGEQLIITSDATAVAVATCLGCDAQMANEADSNGVVFFRIAPGALDDDRFDMLRDQLKRKDLSLNCWSFAKQWRAIMGELKGVSVGPKGA